MQQRRQEALVDACSLGGGGRSFRCTFSVGGGGGERLAPCLRTLSEHQPRLDDVEGRGERRCEAAGEGPDEGGFVCWEDVLAAGEGAFGTSPLDEEQLEALVQRELDAREGDL